MKQKALLCVSSSICTDEDNENNYVGKMKTTDCYWKLVSVSTAVNRASTLNIYFCHFVCDKNGFFLAESAYISRKSICLWHDRSRFRAPPVHAHRYMEKRSSAVMLATKRSAGVTPEMNFREHVTRTTLPRAIKAAHFGFKTQRRRQKKSKTGVSVATQKWLMSSKFLFKKKNESLFSPFQNRGRFSRRHC